MASRQDSKRAKDKRQVKKKVFILRNSKGRYLYINIDKLIKHLVFWQTCFTWVKDIRRASKFNDSPDADVLGYLYKSYSKDEDVRIEEVVM